MRYWRSLVISVMLISLIGFLSSCQGLRKPSKTEPRRLEWGRKGETPTLHMDYNWFCADSSRYVPEIK